MSEDPKYRIPYYYTSEGRPDPLASELRCMDAMCLFSWRQSGMVPSAETWLFLKNFTLTLKHDKVGQVCHLGALSSASRITGDPWPHTGETPECREVLTPFPAPSSPEAALHHITQVISERGMALIACADEKIGIFISSLRSGVRDRGSQFGHVFAVLAVEAGEVHYVDTPIYIIKNRYVPHARHRGIGVMRVEDFLRSLVNGYQLLAVGDVPFEGLLADHPVTQLQTMAKNHKGASRVPDGCHVGDQAYAKLIESLEDGSTDLLAPLPSNYLDAARQVDYLDWKCFEILNMRRTWFRASRARASQVGDGIGRLTVILAESVRLWQLLSNAVCVSPNPAPDREHLTATVRNLFAEAKNLDRELFDQILLNSTEV